MKETMHDCYRSQFTCMAALLAARNELLKEFVAFYAALRPDHIYLIGSGTSYNACTAASFAMEKALGVEVTVFAPSAMGRIYGQRPLAIVVSQSGCSTNTIRSIRRLREDKIPVVTLTDPKDTPVGRMGDLAVDLAAASEQIGPRTRGYSATVLTLLLMALEVVGGEARDEAIAAYHEMAANGESYYQSCQAFYDARLEALKKARKYMFVGKGPTARVADESALKVLETLCYPAIGFEFEEFLHGPVCCADEELAVFFYLSEDEDKDRMLKAAGLVGNITENCYIVTQNPAMAGEKTLVLPSLSPDHTAVFTSILFSQLISARLTEDMGRTRHPGVKDVFANMDTKAAKA